MKRLGVLLLAVIFFAAFGGSAGAAYLADDFYLWDGCFQHGLVNYTSSMGTLEVGSDTYTFVGIVDDVVPAFRDKRTIIYRYFELTEGGSFKVKSPSAIGRGYGDVWEIELTLEEDFTEQAGEMIVIGQEEKLSTANKFVAHVEGNLTLQSIGPWNPEMWARYNEVDYPVVIPVEGEIAYGELYMSRNRELPDHIIGYYRLAGVNQVDNVGVVASGGFLDMSGIDFVTDFGQLEDACGWERPDGGPTDIWDRQPSFFFSIGLDEYIAEFTGGTTAADYVIGSLPLVQFDEDPIADQIGTYDTTMMRMGAWDPVDQAYIEYPFGEDFRPMPGFAFWMLFRDDTTLTFSGYKTPAPDGYFPIKLSEGWNMVGNPFNFPINVAEIIVGDFATDEGFFLLDSINNTVTDPVFWVYENGEYVELTGVLDAGRGGWVYKIAGDGAIGFNGTEPSLRNAQPVYTRSTRDRKPPAPPKGLDPPYTADGGGGGCFINTLGE